MGFHEFSNRSQEFACALLWMLGVNAEIDSLIGEEQLNLMTHTHTHTQTKTNMSHFGFGFGFFFVFFYYTWSFSKITANLSSILSANQNTKCVASLHFFWYHPTGDLKCEEVLGCGYTGSTAGVTLVSRLTLAPPSGSLLQWHAVNGKAFISVGLSVINSHIQTGKV